MLHIYLKELLAELLLEERLEQVEVSVVCYMQGRFYDLLNHATHLETMSNGLRLESRMDLSSFKDYIKM